jgi:hypothetical protein
VKALSFQWLIAKRPFRCAKLTACRKKFAFLSAGQGEVKAGCSRIAATYDSGANLPDFIGVANKWAFGAEIQAVWASSPSRTQDMPDVVILACPAANAHAAIQQDFNQFVHKIVVPFGNDIEGPHK